MTALACASCLYGLPELSDDAAVPPEITTAIIGQSSSPQPGSVILLPAGTGPEASQFTFRLVVARSDDLPVELRIFYDRPRPCFEIGACPGYVARIPVAAAGTPRRSIPPFTLRFTTENHCYRVDAYISRAFQNDLLTEETPDPAHPNDIASVRWYVVRPAANGHVPDLSTCTVED